MFHPA